MTTEELARTAASAALDRKAIDVSILDVRGRTSYADFLILASGTSDRHVSGIAENIAQSMEEAGIEILGKEGVREGRWALIDCGDVIIHVFHQFTRDVYDLDDLWRQAPRVAVPGAEDAAPGANKLP